MTPAVGKTGPGADVVADQPDQFGKFWRAESDKWARVIKDAHIKAN